jgi:hypothetical protein
MATPKQTAANRMNAQKSSGPRTAAGKAVSRFNALKHGIYAVHQIMFDEKPEDLAELSAEYHEHHSPADPDQRLLVDTLVHNEWRLRRTRRVEAELWQTAHDLFIVKNIDTTATCTSGDAFATDSGIFERLQRVVNSCERAWHRALKELQHLQAQEVARAHGLRPEAAPSPAPAPATQPEQCKPGSANLGSVRQNPQTPAPQAPQPPPAPPFTAPASPAATRPRPADRFPTPQEAMDAALKAILRNP